MLYAVECMGGCTIAPDGHLLQDPLARAHWGCLHPGGGWGGPPALHRSTRPRLLPQCHQLLHRHSHVRVHLRAVRLAVVGQQSLVAGWLLAIPRHPTLCCKPALPSSLLRSLRPFLLVTGCYASQHQRRVAVRAVESSCMPQAWRCISNLIVTSLIGLCFAFEVLSLI